MRNRYAGTCVTCSVRVVAGEGFVVKGAARWLTHCAEHEPRPVPPARGDHPGWHTSDLLGFDTETSSPDPATAFLVSAAVTDARGGRRTWLIDPGEKEIPAGAVAVHGVSAERARAEGRPAAECLEELTKVLAEHLGRGLGLVVFNAPFDLAVLDAERRRHGLSPLAEALGRPPEPIVDPLVIDRAVEPYRRGRRTLSTLCEYYGVPLEYAHTAEGDARAALALAGEIGARHPGTASLALPELHDRQAEWALEHARGRQEWLDRERPDHGTVIDGTWP
ncbi:exonuclease domain-containing protein [Nocardiopsis sp. NPDC007018]|uniref:exonuclease domain-containing protein n=1 Tax=Nocardiopsis sp. NPDC007018 TaxID=3155721 RepID=UPI0033F31F51